MTVSRISAAVAADTDSISIPSHQAGDLILLFAYRSTSNVTIGAPSGWCMVTLGGANLQASLTAYKIAASNSETSGTWTNAEAIAVAVYRHTTNVLVVGAGNRNVAAASTTISYSALTTANLFRGSNSFVAGFVGLSGTVAGADGHTVAPTGMTHITATTGTDRLIGVHDTDGTVSSRAASSATQATSLAYHSSVVEILDTGVAKSSGGGIARLINGGLVRGQVQ